MTLPRTVTAASLPRIAGGVLHGVNRVVAPAARRGWLAPGPLGIGLVELETTGRRSGARRPRPLLAVRAGDRVLVGTIRSRSDWMANLGDDPAPSLHTRGGERSVHPELHRWGRASLALLHVGARTEPN